MRYIFLFIPLIFLSCAVSNSPISEYRIDVALKKYNFNTTQCSNKSLKISDAFSSNSLKTLKMNYVENRFKQFAYSQSQWAQIPNKAITNEVAKYIKNTNIFKSVHIISSRSVSDLLLEININDFMQYFEKNATKSYVNAEIDFTLIDLKNRKIIATKSFNSKLDAKPDAKGGVIALNSALENILLDSGKWLAKICTNK